VLLTAKILRKFVSSATTVWKSLPCQKCDDIFFQVIISVCLNG
jgi:hypothetical protein